MFVYNEAVIIEGKIRINLYLAEPVKIHNFAI